ncbi:hypothetical protein ACVIJ6_002314 [Bradyrhizobium sp. USDA 4369]
MRHSRGLSQREQDGLAIQRDQHDRQRDEQAGPHSDPQRAPHQAGIGRAIGLRGERRHRRHQPHAEGRTDEIHRARQGCRRDGIAAEPADEGEIGRHHRDLRQLRQRHRRGEADRVPEFERERRCGRRRRRMAGSNCGGHKRGYSSTRDVLHIKDVCSGSETCGA